MASIAFDFSTALPLTFDFRTAAEPGPLVYTVNDVTRVVTVTVADAVSDDGPYIADAYRQSDGEGVPGVVVTTTDAGTTITFPADATDDIYLVVLSNDAGGGVVAQGYAVVLIRARSAFREENRFVATSGVAVSPYWLQLRGRMRAVVALVNALDIAAASAQIVALRKLETFDHAHLGGVW